MECTRLIVDRYNVIAQTSGGDPDNVLVLTAHTDSVDAVCHSHTPVPFAPRSLAPGTLGPWRSCAKPRSSRRINHLPTESTANFPSSRVLVSTIMALAASASSKSPSSCPNTASTTPFASSGSPPRNSVSSAPSSTLPPSRTPKEPRSASISTST